MNTPDVYTDESTIKIGNTWCKLCTAPKRKLFKKYRKQKKEPEESDPAFIAYIEQNLEKWKAEAELRGYYSLLTNINQLIHDYIKPKKHVAESKDVFMDRREKIANICKTGKVIYLTKKIAREALAQIRQTEQSHKKPVRSYECDECGWWHLTSLPIEDWKKQKVLRL